MRFSFLSIAVLPAFVICLSGAQAQNLPIKDIADEALSLPIETTAAAGTDAPPVTKRELELVPIPISNPAIGMGLGGAARLFYTPDGSTQPWVSGISGGYTSSDTWGIGAFQIMSLAEDRLRFLGFAGYNDAHLRYYGIGPDAGKAGLSVNLNDKAFTGLLDVQGRIFDEGLLSHVHFGARFFYLNLDSTSEDLPPSDRPDLDPPARERNSQIAMIGPSFTFDTRRDPKNPRKGVYVIGSMLLGASWLGSDFTHRKLELDANAYFPLGKKTVIVIRKQLCSASSDTPYYDLCMFGAHGDLRGYEAGRYRDGASWALQAEVRQQLNARISVVGFGGAGGIAENSKAIWKDSTVLYSGGVGLRALASDDSNVNLRTDVAWGKHGAAFYLGVGQAF